eukprot:UN07984
MTSVQNELADLRDFMTTIQQQSQQPLQDVADNKILVLVKGLLKNQSDDIAFLKQRYEEESKLRKAIFNELQDLKGNIRVIVRVRPMNQKDWRNKLHVVHQHHVTSHQ